jgi:hypothetical protein
VKPLTKYDWTFEGWAESEDGSAYLVGEADACIAALQSGQAGVVEALEDCIDSLEYVNRTHPDASGWGVRSERIAKARAALAAVKEKDRG